MLGADKDALVEPSSVPCQVSQRKVEGKQGVDRRLMTQPIG
jgi:hypothetical protein